MKKGLRADDSQTAPADLAPPIPLLARPARIDLGLRLPTMSLTIVSSVRDANRHTNLLAFRVIVFFNRLTVTATVRENGGLDQDSTP